MRQTDEIVSHDAIVVGGGHNGLTAAAPSAQPTVMSAATTAAARVKRARGPVSDSDTPISFVAISGP